MKKIMSIAAVALMVSGETFAGGLLTNTNQNAAFTRQMSQDGIIDITGLYANPAGTAFLSNGWHLSLNSQTAKQRRNITTTYSGFALNANNHSTKRDITGKAFAPVIPSLSLSYNKDKWSVNVHFGLIGGGGKCDFDEGLSSFELLTLSQAVTTIADLYKSQLVAGIQAKYPTATIEQITDAMPGAAAELMGKNGGYSLRSNMKGRSYTFGLQVGGTYKFLDNLAGYVGLRLQYATNNYNGAISDITVAGQPAVHPLTDGRVHSTEITLNTDQTGFGVAPIIGLDYKLNEHWNFAARYEAPTKINLKNSSDLSVHAEEMSKDESSALAQFADGAKVRQDIPGLLSLGAMYSPCKSVRLMAGFHEFFDKSAKCYGDKQKLIDKNTWEVNCGVEYDVCKYITLSASYQNTKYGQSDAYMNDLSFNNSNQMVGGGLRINAAKCCSIDLGYMYTIYKDREVGPSVENPSTNIYGRKNWTAGLGVNLNF